MSEATLILQNMRGNCATVGGIVHTLFRVNRRRFAKPVPTVELQNENFASSAQSTIDAAGRS
jgi:hypothetical protein